MPDLSFPSQITLSVLHAFVEFPLGMLVGAAPLVGSAVHSARLLGTQPSVGRFGSTV